MMHPQIIQADLTFLDDRFMADVSVVVGSEGHILSVGTAAATASPGAGVRRRLRRRALLPGMINAHSHAFQRGMRGEGELFPHETMKDEVRAHGDFWSWREAMYRLVLQMDESRMYALSRQAFEEMLDAGITTVGEFHYLHHDASGLNYALDPAVLAAAHDAGIRMVLLYTYYRTGGIGRPLSEAQRRFCVPTPVDYWRRMDELAGQLKPLQSLGAVVHSIRAAPLEDLVDIHRESRRRGLPFHMHVEEQPKEIADCVAHYGRTPMALIHERLEVDERFTAVHCTHTAAEDMAAFLDAGGCVCLCPSTEANLGDGICDLRRVRDGGGRVCIGSDLNSRLCMAEEMRWIEYAQRLTTRRRGVVTDDRGRVAAPLFQMATIHGATSLAQDVGRIRPGCRADFFTLDLDAPALRGATQHTLLEAFIFGGSERCVADVCVGGIWRRGGGKVGEPA